MKPKHKLPPWLRPKEAPQIHVGVSWYEEAEWAKVKASAVDSRLFEETFGEWQEMAEKALSELRGAGIKPNKCYIKAEELHAWCLAHGKKNDAAARSEFVSEHGRKSHEIGV
jgi:hypothetical protein